MNRKNRTFEIIKDIYKPYRYTRIGKTTVLETTQGKFVLKEKGSSKVSELYKYLTSRSFDNFPKLIEGNRDEINIYEYIEDSYAPKEQKTVDLINIVSSLHNKTSYFKEVSEDNYKEIYENISNNLIYLESEYNQLFEKIKFDIYMSPSGYLLIRNSSKILMAIEFCKKELDSWYAMVKDKSKQRVSVIHNDLRCEHFLKGEKDCLVSWEKSKVDSPVLDIKKLYQNEYFDIDFETALNKYFDNFSFSEDEKKLLFISISIPPEITLEKSEFKNTMIISNMLDYIYKTENLIRPYYAKKEPVKDENLQN